MESELILCNSIEEIVNCWRDGKLVFVNSQSDLNPKTLPAVTFQEVTTEDFTLNKCDYEEIQFKINIFDRCPSGCASVHDLATRKKKELEYYKNMLRQFYKILTSTAYKYRYINREGVGNKRRITCRIRPQTEHHLLVVSMVAKVARQLPLNCCPQTDYEVEKLINTEKWSTDPR